MLLPRPAPDRFWALPVAAGLRSLIVQAPDAGRGIVTRAAAARCCRGGEHVVKASGDVTSIIAQGEGMFIKGTNDADDEENTKEKEAGSAEEEEDEELDGFWVSYGRRCPRRRLPPPLPSLVARGALRRARTGDGRLVIRIVPLVRPDRVRARRRRGDTLTTTRLVEHKDDDDSTVMAPPLIRHEDAIGSARAAGHDDVSTPPAVGVHDVEDVVVAPERETTKTAPVVVPPPRRVSSVGCFEDVFRFDPIGGGGGSLHQMPSRLRMVH